MKPYEFEQLKQSLIEDGTIKQVGFNGNQTIIDKDYIDKIFVKNGIYAYSQRKIESLLQIAEIQRYYQCNPVRFIRDFFNIELLDAQAWIVQQAWTCPNVLLVCSRGYLRWPHYIEIYRKIKIGKSVKAKLRKILICQYRGKA